MMRRDIPGEDLGEEHLSKENSKNKDSKIDLKLSFCR